MKTLEFNYDAEFASEVMETIPAGYINKTVCGCGLTTVALENDEDAIIAVPKIGLVTNKVAQYPNTRCEYEILGISGEFHKEDVEDYVDRCVINNQPIKIMVTYDSLHKVEHLLDRAKLVIDESDQILPLMKNNSRRASIIHLLNVAKSLKDTVSFISATPTDLKYMPEWISEINQVKMNWKNTLKMQPITAERTYPFKALKEEFLKPLSENGFITIDKKEVKKVMVFINSVTRVTEIIKELKLDKSECGIFCGDSLKNDNKISGINRYISGVTPKYLFITSSGFAGIDIYDEEALTIVVSNTSKSFTMVDILTDLKQAVSRNRCKTNKFYGTYLYIYNQSIFNQTEEELLKELNNKYEEIHSGIRLFNKGVDDNEIGGTAILERDTDFTAYTILDIDTGYREMNEIVFNADRYHILELRNQYTKGFNIIGTLGAKEVIEPKELPKSVTYLDLVNYFKLNHKKGVIYWGPYSSKTEWVNVIEECYTLFKRTYNNYSEAKQMIQAKGDSFKLLVLNLRRVVKSKLDENNRISNKDLKVLLQRQYNKEGIKRTAKPTDIYELFGEKGVKPYKSSGVRGFEILK